MPLTDIGSYVTVLDEITAHWESVNTELGGAPATDLKLQGGFAKADLTTLRNQLNTVIIAEEDLQNAREIAAASRDTSKATVRQKLGQFRAMLRALIPNSKYASAAPVMPEFGAAESRFMAPFDDMASLWGRINADATLPGFTPPLVIGGYTLAQFTTDVAALRTAYGQLTTAELDQSIGRQERIALLPQARERMVQYRAAVEGVFGPEHPLTLSLPELSAPPGSTPEAVTLTGTWNGAANQAELSWSASANPNLEEYEVRSSPGASYDSASSSVVGNVPPGTTTLNTTTGLETPGDVASFKVFVRLTTGNEAGSNAVAITRP